tara:strand:- start:869 stop:1150 length:282 start_codon:yes stop_codon:yes gene_type:complete
MVAKTCYICNNQVGAYVYKAYDQTLCSQYCCDNLIKNFDYDHTFRLVRKGGYMKQETKIVKPVQSVQQNSYIYNIFNKLTLIDYIWKFIFYCN